MDVIRCSTFLKTLGTFSVLVILQHFTDSSVRFGGVTDDGLLRDLFNDSVDCISHVESNFMIILKDEFDRMCK
jgi:hypothetical protein